MVNNVEFMAVTNLVAEPGRPKPLIPMAFNNTAVSAPRGYSDVYGGVPVLPSTGQLASNLTGILNQAIPNFSGLTGQASGIIGSAMSGQLPQDVQDVIQNAAATQAVMGGMPGSSRISGSLYGNRTLRDLGLTSLQRQDKGVTDLISLLQGVSGTAAPTFGQAQEQENARAKYEAAPEPAAAATEQQRLYDKYANPAALPNSGGGGGGSEVPWWMRGTNGSNFLGNPLNNLYGVGGRATNIQQSGFPVIRV